VKALARQTSEATEDIRRRIEGIQHSASETVQAIGAIGEVIGEVNAVSRTIAAAVEEQSATTKEIARSVAGSAQAADTVSTGVQQTAAATREVTESIARVDASVKVTSQSAVRTQASGVELSARAEHLQQLVSGFRVSTQRFDSSPIKVAHTQWKGRLADLLAGRQSLTLAEVTSHRDCKFGKWYFGDGTRDFGQEPTFQAIDAYHAAIHAAAREIVELHHAGRAVEATCRLDEFGGLTQELFTVLDRFAEGVNAPRTGRQT
jgi:methyl-accepting chemotaxis protein